MSTNKSTVVWSLRLLYTTSSMVLLLAGLMSSVSLAQHTGTSVNAAGGSTNTVGALGTKRGSSGSHDDGGSHTSGSDHDDGSSHDDGGSSHDSDEGHSGSAGRGGSHDDGSEHASGRGKPDVGKGKGPRYKGGRADSSVMAGRRGASLEERVLRGD